MKTQKKSPVKGRSSQVKLLLITVAVLAVIGTATTIFTLAAPGRRPTGSFVLSTATTPHGSTISAGVTTNSPYDNRLFTQCYSPTMGGTYVYAAYSGIENGQSLIGPLTSSLWPDSGAECSVKLGYFTRDGFGKWVTLSSSSFKVTAN